MTKEKTIGQIKLALNHKRVQELIKENRKRGNDIAFDCFMNIVVWPAIEQAYERGNSKNSERDKPITIKTDGIKW